MAAREKLEGMTFGDFVAKEYLGNKKYLMVCNICGEERKLYATNIKRLVGVTCSKSKIDLDLTGQHFGDWTVIKYVGNKRYLCRCNCENQTEREVLKCNLLNGTSTSCGHKVNHYGDLTGKRFGDWLVLGKEGYRWKCQCQCDKKTIAIHSSTDLVKGKTKSCGHDYNEFTDISGKQFGLWKVIEYIGNQHYKCECQCENKTIANIRKADLLSGASTSCGCNKMNKIKETLETRYGEVAPNKVSNPRSKEQIDIISSKEALLNFITNLDYKPTTLQLSDMLDIGLSRLLVKIHEYKLDDYVILNPQTSHAEQEIIAYIKAIYDKEIILRDRQILSGKELDIYLPDIKLAIEFNGSYWHSNEKKSIQYHQLKSIECMKQGIRLIHIYEYEWMVTSRRIKIQHIINRAIRNNPLKGVEFTELNKEDAIKFIYENSLYGGETGGRTNGRYIALKHKDKIVSAMSIDITNTNINILEKVDSPDADEAKTLKFLIYNLLIRFKPDSITTSIDLDKSNIFNYAKLGFSICDNGIQSPSYKIVNLNKHEIYNDTLVNKLKTDVKIYDSGKINLIYKNNK